MADAPQKPRTFKDRALVWMSGLLAGGRVPQDAPRAAAGAGEPDVRAGPPEGETDRTLLARFNAVPAGVRAAAAATSDLTKEARRKPLPLGMGISRFVRLLPVPAGSWYNANTRTVRRANAVRSRRHDVVWCPK